MTRITDSDCPTHAMARGTGWLREYAAIFLLSLGLAVLLLHVRPHDLFHPNAYYSDGLTYLAAIQGMIEGGWNGWVMHVGRLGAPTEAHIFDTMLYQQAGLHNLLMKLIGFLVPDASFVVNAYYLLSYPLIVMSTYLLFRHARLERIWALVGGLLFAFTFYHVYRNTYNVYLGAYFMVPLGFLVLLWLIQGRLAWNDSESFRALLKRPLFRVSAAILFLLAMSDAYYTFFFLPLFVLQAVAPFAQGRPRPWRQTALVGLLLGALAAGILVLAVPAMLYRAHNPNPERGMYPLQRHYYMADHHALRLDTMIVPSPQHRIARIREAVTSYQNWIGVHGEPYDTSLSGPLTHGIPGAVMESYGVPIGLIGTLGFFLGLAALPLLLRRKEEVSPTAALIQTLGGLNLLMLLLAMVGGFGVMFAVIYPEVRFYIRFALYIQLLSLLIACLAAQYFILPWLAMRLPRLALVATWLLPLGMLAFGLVDQMPFHGANHYGDYWANRPAVDAKDAQVQRDRDYFAQVEQALPEGSMVFELPYISFWTYNGLVGSLGFDHLVPYLNTRHLRWTYGSVVGTKVDLWQRRVAAMPVPDGLREMAAVGFRAVYVDRNGFADQGALLVDQLHETLKTTPLVSADGRRLVFPLPDPGFTITLDPSTLRPVRLQVTDPQRITRESLPQYVNGNAFMAWLATHRTKQMILTGKSLSTLLDLEMIDVLDNYDTNPLPDAAFRGRITCPGVTVADDPKKTGLRVPVTIRNDSDLWWNFDATRNNALVVRSHLLDAGRHVVAMDYDYSLPIGMPLRSHSAMNIEAVLPAERLATLSGAYILQLDVMQQNVAWLAGKTGNPPCEIKLPLL